MNIILKQVVVLTIIAVILISISTFVINFFAYYDITSNCYISLRKDPVSGDTGNMRAVIEKIKKEDRESYKILCTYIDSIYENYCPKTSPISPAIELTQNDGCYIRGSKVMYVRPEYEKVDNIIEKRTNTIIKYSSKSKLFWDGIRDR